MSPSSLDSFEGLFCTPLDCRPQSFGEKTFQHHYVSSSPYRSVPRHHSGHSIVLKVIILNTTRHRGHTNKSLADHAHRRDHFFTRPVFASSFPTERTLNTTRTARRTLRKRCQTRRVSGHVLLSQLLLLVSSSSSGFCQTCPPLTSQAMPNAKR